MSSRAVCVYVIHTAWLGSNPCTCAPIAKDLLWVYTQKSRSQEGQWRTPEEEVWGTLLTIKLHSASKCNIFIILETN